jgi:hypothetical protein
VLDGAIEQAVAVVVPVLMIVAKAVAVPLTWTERLTGNTAVTRLVAKVLAVKVAFELTLVRMKVPPVVSKGTPGNMCARPDRGPIDVLRSYPLAETEEI